MKGSWDRERDPLVALNRGDGGLFEEFVRSEAATLVAFFQHLGGSRVEAEDLAQEVFFKLYRKAANYVPQGTFEAFVLRVARNAWIDRRRREAARVPARLFSALEGESNCVHDAIAIGHEPERRLAQFEEQRRIARALSTLSQSHALIFELAIVQARPYPEIAAELEIPVGTVKSRVFHALRRMREALEPREVGALNPQALRERSADASSVIPRPLGGQP